MPFQNGAVWFLQPLGDREEDLVGFMEGPGMEQNSAMLGQTDPQDHPAPQAAPSAHSPSSGAIATLTGAATEPGWLQEQAQAGITRETPPSYSVPWRPPGWVIQTAALFTAL